MSTIMAKAFSLKSLRHAIREDKIRLPDCQTGRAWGDARIRDLRVSISHDVPIRHVMTLDAGGTT